MMRAWLIAAAMVCAAVMAKVLTPEPMSSAQSAREVRLAERIPTSFGDWRVDETVIPIQPSPDVQATLDQVYSDVLARTYVNGRGERVMLSIAYGAQQSRTLQVHKPEVCYVAQGFTVSRITPSAVPHSGQFIRAVRLMSTKGLRYEPITYWIRMGDVQVQGWWEQNWARLGAGLTGRTTDGVLFRVSSISRDVEEAYSVHDRFIDALLQGVSESTARLLVAAPARS
jgi:EpsI family protein